MKPDDELCICFHVTRRKVENYLRIEKPAVPSQLSECFGAGTGCGWCRPYLRRLWKEAQKNDPAAAQDLPEKDAYAAARTTYRREQESKR